MPQAVWTANGANVWTTNGANVWITNGANVWITNGANANPRVAGFAVVRTRSRLRGPKGD